MRSWFGGRRLSASTPPAERRQLWNAFWCKKSSTWKICSARWWKLSKGWYYYLKSNVFHSFTHSNTDRVLSSKHILYIYIYIPNIWQIFKKSSETDGLGFSVSFCVVTQKTGTDKRSYVALSDRQISQEDKNWEQNIQELQKKVGFHTSPQTHSSAIVTVVYWCYLNNLLKTNADSRTIKEYIFLPHSTE